MSVTVLVLAHGDWLARVPSHPPFRIVDLAQFSVPPGIPSQAWLSESAFFLTDVMLEPHTDFIWLCSGRHDDKRVELKTRIIDLPRFIPEHEREIWCVDLGDSEWPEAADVEHPGLTALTLEMMDTFGLGRGPAFFANSWCMHRTHVPAFLERWRSMFWHFHTKYGADLPFDVGRHQEHRKGSYFYERMTMTIFADMGLRLRQVP